MEGGCKTQKLVYLVGEERNGWPARFKKCHSIRACKPKCMDPKEARDYIGYNVHFNPEMNQIPSTSPPKKHWWTKMPSNAKPIQIQRQLSNTSTGSDISPVGSPTSAPINPPAFGTHMPQPNMYKQFHFNQ